MGALLCAAMALPATAWAQGRAFEHVSRGDINGNGDFGAGCNCHMSADGTRVWFQSSERLRPEDTDNAADVYERSSGGLRLVTPGTTDIGVFLRHVSSDGERVIVTTTDVLDPASGDTGSKEDVYRIEGGTVTLLSGGSSQYDWSFAGATPDGTRVYMETDHKLLDSDPNQDVYERTSVFRLISTNGGAAQPAGIQYTAFFDGVADDGSLAVFSSGEGIDGSDTDGLPDIYGRGTAGDPVWLSRSDEGGLGNGPHSASFAYMTPDGSRVLFNTADKLTSADTDPSMLDVYERSSTTKLVSGPGAGATASSFAAAASNGTRILFQTGDQLDPVGDPDGAQDVYEPAGASFNLLSGGTANIDTAAPTIAPDGSSVFFQTTESLVGVGDGDGVSDVYARDGGALSLITQGTPTADAAWDAGFGRRNPSADGRRIWFSTTDRATAEDSDNNYDIYEGRPDGPPTLVSGGVGDDTIAIFVSAATDGSAVLIFTDDRLAPTDTDDRYDLYLSRAAEPGAGGGGAGGTGGPGGGGGGGTGGPGGGGIGSGVPPNVLAASVNPARFAVNRRGAAEVPVTAAKKGTTFRYTLSEDGRVVFTIERPARGRRVAGRCVRQTRRNRPRRRCTRYVRVGRFAQDGAAGANRKRFSGKIGRRPLKPRPYRATLTASDGDGTGAPKRLRFRVLRR